MKIRVKNSTLTLKVIGWLQVIGGITGLGLMAYLMLQTGAINGALLLIFLIGISLFCFSIYSGKRLVWDAQKKSGIILSIINQVIQIFQWSLSGYGFTYSSGAELAIGVQGFELKFNISAIISSFKMSINSSEVFFLKINIIAIIIIFVLADILKKNQEEKERVITKDMSSSDVIDKYF